MPKTERPHPIHDDPDLGMFAYLLLLSETDAPPDPGEMVRSGDLRRRPDGGYWVFDGVSWIEW